MSYLQLKKVRAADHAPDDAVKITLFRGTGGNVCGWYVGPVRYTKTGVDLPYLARSRQALGSVAIIRAIEAAREIDAPVTVVDPDDLWGPAWTN